MERHPLRGKGRDSMTNWFSNLSDSVRTKHGLSAEHQLPTLEELASSVERGIGWEERDRAEFGERIDALFKAVVESADSVRVTPPPPDFSVIEQARIVASISSYLGRVRSPDAPLPGSVEEGALVPHIIDAMAHLDTIVQTEAHRPLPPPDVEPKVQVKRLKHPLAPLIAGWIPRSAAAPEGKRRMLPARLAMANGDDARVPKLFSPPAHIAPGADGVPLILPGFGNVIQPEIALPLELWGMGSGPEVSPGRGAPWALRMFVGALLATPSEARRQGSPAEVTLTLGELIRWLYPNSRQSAARWWPQFLRAVEDLESQANRIPMYRKDTDTWAAVRVVSVSEHPVAPSELDGPVVFRVDLPLGSDAGPKVSPNLLGWGAQDAPAFRLLLNLAYYWYKPGHTNRPIGPRADGQGSFYAQSPDPSYYPMLSDCDLVAYAFPSSATNNRRVLHQRMRAALTRLADAGELRIIDGKVLPPRASSETTD